VELRAIHLGRQHKQRRRAHGAIHAAQLIEMRHRQNPFLFVAAVCDRRGFAEISVSVGARRAPLQLFCRGFKI